MESKKINQLATNVSPQTSDLTIIGDPTTGVSKKITLLQIANLFATTGTVSSVAVTETGDALTITGSPITTAGTINIGFAGDATQYVRGDGALADFPTSTGGGSSVSYYLNSSVSQGTIGGVAYRELSKDPISGAGTDITISANGYVASYITDANDPSLLEVPGGNFNCEFYFSVNSNAHNPYVYAELYKYDGTTFTLLGSSQSVPEYLSNGTTLSPYYFAIPVATAALTITDRISIRIYVNVDGRTVTLHTENNHLCQVVTTFSKGLISLNNLTRQNQFFATGTSGTDFGISSATATHTFNLPVASAANTGKLSSTDWSTFNGKVPYTGATADVDLGIYGLSANLVAPKQIILKKDTILGGAISIETGSGFAWGGSNDTILLASGASNTLSLRSIVSSVLRTAILDFSTITASASRTFTLPDITGTLALLEGSQTFSGAKSFSGGATFTSLLNINRQINIFKTPSLVAFTGGYITNYGTSNGIVYADGDTGNLTTFIYNFGGNYNYTFPASTGTIALTSNLSSYVPYTGATGAVNLGFNLLTTNSINLDGNSVSGVLNIKSNSSITTSGAGYVSLVSGNVNQLSFVFNGGNSATFTSVSLSASRTYSLPDAGGTLALLSGTQTFSGNTTFSLDLTVNSVKVGRGNGSISTNSVLGETALNSNTTGSTNTAIGYGALQLNTTGLSNTAIGHAALNYNTTSSWNTAVGVSALGLSTGGQNTAIGYAALSNNTTGVFNIAIGYTTGTSIVTGNYNTIIGNYAGTAAMSNNIVLADGQGNIRYQWDGTNNVFGNPISGTSATFSGSGAFGSAAMSSARLTITDGTSIAAYWKATNTNAATRDWTIITNNNNFGDFAIRQGNSQGADATSGTDRLLFSATGAATFSSSVTAGGSSLFNANNGTLSADILTIKGGGGTGAFGFRVEANNGQAIFRTNNFSYNVLMCENGGNVGIGTSSPSALLHLSQSTTNLNLYLQNTSGSGKTWAVNSDNLGSFNIHDTTANRLTITSGGDVGIGNTGTSGHRLSIKSGGTTSSTYALVVTNSSSTDLLYVRSDGYMYFGLEANSPYNIAQAGRSCILASNGSVGYLSSTRESKTNIENLNDISWLYQLNPVSFNYRKKDDENNYTNEAENEKWYGLIADEAESVNEDLVFYNTKEDGTKRLAGVEYNKLITALIKSAQEQQAQIDELKALIAAK